MQSFKVVASNSLREVPWWPRIIGNADAQCYAFQCADILDCWLESIGSARRIKPLFVTIFAADDTPALLLPLGIEEIRGARVLKFLDHGVSDYNAPILYPNAKNWNARAIWNQLRRSLPRFDIAVLEKMPNVIDGMANPLAGLANDEHLTSGHYASLPATWNEFARTRLPKAADTRRRRRNLEKHGQLRFEIAKSDPERFRFLEAMMEFKREKYIKTKGHDLFAEPGNEQFYRLVTQRVTPEAIHVSALLLEEKILAAHWGYVFAGTFYHLMPAYADGKWRAYAPGRLLNEWLMEWSINSGLKVFDFGIGDEPYKNAYCDGRRPLKDAVLPVTLKGQLFAATWRMKAAVKRSVSATPLGELLRSAQRRWRVRHAARTSGDPTND